ncbi:MAG: hypothetical protein ABEI78_02445 [Candidatus Nanohaloarchaea archaeon]
MALQQVLNRLKQGWKNFKTQFKTRQRTEEQIQREQVDRINKELDYDRGVARGRQKQEERKRKSLEKEVKRDRQKDVSEMLQQQKEQLSNKSFKDATSLKKLFRINQQTQIDMLSRDMQQKFGEFQDIWITQSGQIALVAETPNGDNPPIAVGRDFTDVLRNPGGLRNEVQNNLIAMNVNKKGQPVESPENQKVPDLIQGPNGEWTFTESHQEEYMEKVGELRSQISNLRSREKAKEKSMVKMSEKIDELERDLETANALNESNKEALEKRLEEMKNVVKQYDQMEKEMTKMSQLKQTSEEALKGIQNVRDEMVAEIQDKINKDEMDMKEDQIRRVLEIAREMEDLNKDHEVQQIQTSQQQQQQEEQAVE